MPFAEEIPVQLLTQEISKKEGLEIIPSNYDKMVDKLRNINKEYNICYNDYTFAKELFNLPIDKRFKRIADRILNKSSVITTLKEIEDDALWKK